MIGTTIAHFKITAHLGSGGMGEVYQVTDTKLGRSVAIKLLPEAFASDAERVARFERERHRRGHEIFDLPPAPYCVGSPIFRAIGHRNGHNAVVKSKGTRQRGLQVIERKGSSGRTRTYNPPVNSRMLCH